ncbi:DNA polymerase delta subunit 3 [Tachyglossus aculeatus]|uniref:DNA polymerase delta subunit 3 n=1 Tax=Tachyglossus aculeatus TaxID=9261 RepID=UPI0018F6DB6B|nr:DNA polymerase delta subunit 3 [Tachyglossus aculeatus]
MAEQLYLDNIDEFVVDQNRIVTYKWLSHTLGVHVNQAKQMLYEYVERKRKENSGAQLHVTYLVSGNLIQNGSACHKVAVVREDKLEAAKSKLAVTASIHVYSIQRAALKDSGPLFNTDYDILKSNLHNCSKFSAIQCAAAVPRARAENSPEKLDQTTPRTSSEALPVNGLPSNGHGPAVAKPTSHPPRGIMGMFANKPVSKPQDSHKETKTEAKEAANASSTTSKPPGKGSVMSNFFGKAAMKKLKVNAELDQKGKEDKTTAQPPVVEPEVKRPPGTGPEKPCLKTEPVKTQQKEKKSAREKRPQISEAGAKDDANKKKKRRRIKLPESDSSEDEAVPDSPGAYEAELPPAPPPPLPLKSEPEPLCVKTSSGEKKRKRKRVLKSRMFTDEEGCMVTEKVYESESCTDSEEEACKSKAAAVKEEPKEERKNVKRGPTAPGKANRQASIIGFFQKK